MNKPLILFLLSLLMPCFISAQKEYTLTKDDIQTDGSGSITKYLNRVEKNIIIPETIDGETILFIEDNSFFDSDLEHVELPNTIKKIGRFSFSNNKLKSITFPKSLEEIDLAAFSNNKIVEVHIPENVKLVSSYAFKNNEIEILVLEGKPILGDGCFNENKLISYNGESSNGLIYKLNSEGKFDNTTLISYAGSKKTIDFIPNTTKLIGSAAFFETSVESVIIPGSIHTIRDYAFSKTNLKEVVFNEGLKVIANNAFAFSEVEILTTPLSLRRIGAEAFYSNPLAKINLNKGLQFIGRNAFFLHKIKNKESLVLPTTIIEFEGNPFLFGELVSLDGFKLQLPNVITKGYNFIKWENDKGSTVSVGTELDNERNYKAVITPSFFLKVRFLDFDGTLLKEEKVAYGKDASSPVFPNNRPGYFFKEWDTNFKEVITDIEVYAIYREAQLYTATFVDEEGNVLKTSTQTEDIGVLPPSPVIKDGFVFFGWNNYSFYSRRTYIASPYLIPIGALVSVNFVDEDGVTLIGTPFILNPGDDAIAPEPPFKEGKTFISWDKSFENVTENLIVKAIYESNSSLSINDFLKKGKQFSIYPTHVKDKLFIKLPTTDIAFYVDIFDMTGKRVSQQFIKTGNRELIPPTKSGVYLLKLSNNNHTPVPGTIKFIKE